MGKSTLNVVSLLFLSITKCLHTHIIENLSLSTQTITFKLDLPIINLLKVSQNNPHCIFEGEIFPALSINLWNPIHVNVFSSGKVVVLGKNALNMKDCIEKWLLINCK